MQAYRTEKTDQVTESYREDVAFPALAGYTNRITMRPTGLLLCGGRAVRVLGELAGLLEVLGIPTDALGGGLRAGVLDLVADEADLWQQSGQALLPRDVWRHFRLTGQPISTFSEESVVGRWLSGNVARAAVRKAGPNLSEGGRQNPPAAAAAGVMSSVELHGSVRWLVEQVLDLSGSACVTLKGDPLFITVHTDCGSVGRGVGPLVAGYLAADLETQQVEFASTVEISMWMSSFPSPSEGLGQAAEFGRAVENLWMDSVSAWELPKAGGQEVVRIEGRPAKYHLVLPGEAFGSESGYLAHVAETVLALCTGIGGAAVQLWHNVTDPRGGIDRDA